MTPQTPETPQASPRIGSAEPSVDDVHAGVPSGGAPDARPGVQPDVQPGVQPGVQADVRSVPQSLPDGTTPPSPPPALQSRSGRGGSRRAARRAGRRARPRSVHRFRWVFQLFFLIVFLALLTMTVWPVATGLVSGFLLADPLIALNSVAHGLFRWAMLLAVPVILSPLFLGRVFCGYVCPMGFLIELFGPKKERHPGPGARKVLRRVPLFGLVVVMMFILVGSAWFLVMDPISLLTRSATTLLYPAVNQVLTWAGDLLYRVGAFQGGVDSFTNALTGRLIYPNGLAFALQILILVMFVAVLAVSWIERRMWCRHLCPLGAVLGLMGRSALFGRVVDPAACTSCGACARACPMDAIRDDGLSTDMSRCECGLECADACRQGAVRWGYKPRKQYEYDPSRRALLIGAAAAFAGTFAIFRGLRYAQAAFGAETTTTAAAAGGAAGATTTTTLAPATTALGDSAADDGSTDSAAAGAEGAAEDGATGEGPAHITIGLAPLIRPPGSQAEADFLASCTRCGQCLKVCPTNVLQPAAREAGLEGTFTPRMDFNRSYCEWTCAECGTVCPTRSIRPLPLPEKQRTVIGLAVIDHSLCLPWAKNTECLVCEELCPIPKKAVVFVGEPGAGAGADSGSGATGAGASQGSGRGTGSGQGQGRGGGGGAGATTETSAADAAAIARAAASGIKLPLVLERHCTGCGICQYNCPVQGVAAIVVQPVPEGSRGR